MTVESPYEVMPFRAPVQIWEALRSRLQPNPYRDLKSKEESAMAKPSDAVTWIPFGLFVTIAIAVFSGGFAYLHSDMGDLKADIKDVRAEIRNTRNDVTAAVGETNKRLDTLIEQGKRK